MLGYKVWATAGVPVHPQRCWIRVEVRTLRRPVLSHQTVKTHLSFPPTTSNCKIVGESLIAMKMLNANLTPVKTELSSGGSEVHSTISLDVELKCHRGSFFVL